MLLLLHDIILCCFCCMEASLFIQHFRSCILQQSMGYCKYRHILYFSTCIVHIFNLQNNCCLSVVRDFSRLKRYNIHSIIEEGSQDEPAKTDSLNEVRKLQEDDREDSSQKTAGVAVSSESGPKKDPSVWSLHKNSDRDASGTCEEQNKVEPATAD